MSTDTPPDEHIDTRSLLAENNRLLEENIRLLKQQERLRKRQVLFRVLRLLFIIAVLGYIYLQWITPLQRDIQAIQTQTNDLVEKINVNWSDLLPF